MPPGELERTGELLVEEGVVLHEDLVRGLAESGLKGSELGRLLEGIVHAKRAELAAFLAANFRIPAVEDLRKLELKPDAARILPEAIARKHEVVPVARVGEVLCVAKANYYNRAAIQELRKVTGLKIKVLQADETQVRAAVDLAYGKGGSIPAPGARRATAVSAARPAAAPAPASVLEEVSSLELISPALEEVPPSAVPAPSPVPVAAIPADDVLEVLDAIRIPSQEYVSAGRHPLSRLVLEFEDLFAVGKPAAPGRFS